MGRSTCGTTMIILATILIPITLVFLAVSFATDHWLEFYVNRSKTTTPITTISDTLLSAVGDRTYARITHRRHRGFFRECYPGNDTAFLINEPWKSQVSDGWCFNINFDIPENSGVLSDEKLTRLHLLRATLALFVIAIFSFLIATIFGLVLCCARRSKWANLAGLFAYIAAFCTAASIALFHGAEYVERNRITDGDIYFYQQWTEGVKNATTRSYGYSYILGWVGMILAAITATFFVIAGWYIAKERYRRQEKAGRARDYVENSYPAPLEAPYAAPYDYYARSGYPAYPGPYQYELEGKRPVQALTYPEPYWSWS